MNKVQESGVLILQYYLLLLLFRLGLLYKIIHFIF